jgi:hypothetical protein
MIHIMSFESKSFAPKREKIHSSEAARERLKCLLSELSERQNEYLAPFLPEGPAGAGALDSFSAIRADVFSNRFGGPFDQKELDRDSTLAREREKEWSAAGNPSTQKFYSEKYGANTEDEIIAAWKKNREVHDGALAEMALTVLLQKFLGDGFLVMRTNCYDDYVNHIDNIVIEKSTGAVLCTFDEFIGAVEDERFKKKMEKERASAEKSGATIKYGVALEKNAEGKARFALRAIRDIPMFTLRIDKNKEELFALIDEFGDTLDTEKGETGRRVFSAIIQSLSEQEKMLRDNPLTNPKILEKLDEFAGALSGIKLANSG